MSLMKLAEMKNFFEERIRLKSECFVDSSIFGKNDLKVFGKDGIYVLSFQVGLNSDTTDSLRQKFNYLNEHPEMTFIPIFLVGPQNPFIFPYKGNKGRITNCLDNSSDIERVYGVQERVKLTSRLRDGEVVCFKEPRGYDMFSYLQIFQTGPVYAKTIPKMGDLNLNEPKALDRQFRPMPLQRALFFKEKPLVRELSGLGLFNGHFSKIEDIPENYKF